MGDNFSLLLETDEYQLHTPEHPFCFDPSCPCHEDTDAIAAVAQALEEGLLTPDEATDLVLGRLL